MDHYPLQQLNKSQSLETLSTFANSENDQHSNESVNTTRKSKSSSSSSKRLLFHKQLRLLLWSTGISLISFLFFFLNVYALVTLMTFVSSVILLIYIGLVYVKNMIKSGEVNILTLLPEPAQEYMKMSLHDILMDVSNQVYGRK